jgi:hypothetical protein
LLGLEEIKFVNGKYTPPPVPNVKSKAKPATTTLTHPTVATSQIISNQNPFSISSGLTSLHNLLNPIPLTLPFSISRQPAWIGRNSRDDDDDDDDDDDFSDHGIFMLLFFTVGELFFFPPLKSTWTSGLLFK